MISLGIECTAHTFGIGIADEKKILADVRDVYKPKAGGIHPIEAKNHHDAVKDNLLEEALQKANLTMNDIDIITYSAGPGLPPCLKVGAQFVSQIAKKKPVIAVNHPVAHIEIGKFLTDAKDPIVIYVSGGNTQIIGYAANRYRIFGETEDIAIGNAIDTFMREVTDNPGFGGPLMEKLAEGGKYIDLPYVVKGMDLSFSGILTSAIQKWTKESKGKTKTEQDILLSNLCFSFQETCYSMLTEVTERALAHTGKGEVLLTGGVAASKRLTEMLKIMCEEREAKFYSCPIEYSGDNGSMIAVTGLLGYKSGQKPIKNIDFNSRWRTNEVEITWIK
ncbi:MAG: KEOPS complex N(6)-L-threonylcarbamoyladenine synthase Kae1 [Candidatus Aenigmarchaeota archaeon]|nr:KEOPS complex N(6)-L-threonylcarbamoyladenine synthase Kae1 [Candidatus Aenigmarchaeota archaeon]